VILFPFRVNVGGVGGVYLGVFIKNAARGRLDADFEEFVHRRSSALLGTAVLLVGDRGTAEDLLQTALLRTALHWRSAREHPEAYVRRALVNLARDWWRRSKRRVSEQELDDEAPPHPDPADGVVDRAALMRALAGLPMRQREVVVLRYFADLSVTDTADALRMSEGSVKTHTSRAMAHLRQVLGANEPLKEEAHGHR
jgi:RNA polymerase sigma-70 factor (sigma-E family)